MALFRTVEPAAEPVTLADAKAQLRITHVSEDDLLAGLIRAARDDVERATGVAMIDQAWRLTLDDWPPRGTTHLLRHPVKEILSVTTFGPDGEASLVDPSRYELDALSRPARLHFEQAAPALKAMNGVEIDFTAGFGEAGPDVPDLLKRAILLLVAHWYEFRAAFGADEQPASYTTGYDRLISSYRLRKL